MTASPVRSRARSTPTRLTLSRRCYIAVASERHIQLAPTTGDPLRVVISAFHRSTRYLRLGDYTGGLRVLERVEEHLDEPSAVATQIHLRNAVMSARAGRLDRADEYFAEARAMQRDDQVATAGSTHQS